MPISSTFARLFLMAACVGALFSPARACSAVSNVKLDEEVVFYPALGCPAGKAEWEVELRGCVFEPEKRGISMFALRKALAVSGVRVNEAEQWFLSERARLFMVDSERGKRVAVRINGREFTLKKTGGDGQFSDTVRIPAHGPGTLRLIAILPKGDDRIFAGDVFLPDPAGLAVISDIDDTIKVSEVGDRRGLLRATFLEPFRPVPDMADAYRALASNYSPGFFYVSASPWQLFEPLSAFTSLNRFPAGIFRLKEFRLQDRSRTSLLQSPEKYKPDILEDVLKKFPKKSFILVGDSGEKDPEIYAALARKYPKQVLSICIRDVSGEDQGSPRYRHLFGENNRVLLVFKDPQDLARLTLPLPPRPEAQ